MSPLDGARQKAAQLLAELHEMRGSRREMRLPEIEFSMGVAGYPVNGKSGLELLTAVDAALYRAKRAAGGRVVAAA